MREGEKLEQIESERAKGRSGKRTDLKENFPEGDRGQTRDKVAKKTGIGSGRTYDTGKKIWEKANEGDDQAKEIVTIIFQGATM